MSWIGWNHETLCWVIYIVIISFSLNLCLASSKDNPYCTSFWQQIAVVDERIQKVHATDKSPEKYVTHTLWVLELNNQFMLSSIISGVSLRLFAARLHESANISVQLLVQLLSTNQIWKKNWYWKKQKQNNYPTTVEIIDSQSIRAGTCFSSAKKDFLNYELCQWPVLKCLMDNLTAKKNKTKAFTVDLEFFCL